MMKKEIRVDKELIGQTLSFRCGKDVRQGILEKVVLHKTPCVSNKGSWTFIENDVDLFIREDDEKLNKVTQQDVVWDSVEPLWNITFKLPRVVDMLAEIGLGEAYVSSGSTSSIYRNGEWILDDAEDCLLSLVRYNIKWQRVQEWVVCNILSFNITKEGYSMDVVYYKKDVVDKLSQIKNGSDNYGIGTLSQGSSLPFNWWKRTYPTVEEARKARKEDIWAGFGEPMVTYHYDVTEDGLV